jgi:hypothetical protein
VGKRLPGTNARPLWDALLPSSTIIADSRLAWPSDSMEAMGISRCWIHGPIYGRGTPPNSIRRLDVGKREENVAVVQRRGGRNTTRGRNWLKKDVSGDALGKADGLS